MERNKKVEVGMEGKINERKRKYIDTINPVIGP